VSAAPWGKRQVFAGTFMRGGLFPKRSGVVFHGHVVKRAGSDRFPIAIQKSGVIIPQEMVAGETASAFRSTASTVVVRRVEHELSRLMP